MRSGRMVLASEKLPAVDKSAFLADMAMEKARDLGARQQWSAALSWGEARLRDRSAAGPCPRPSR